MPDPVPIAQYSFLIGNGTGTTRAGTQLKVTAKAKDGTTYEQTFSLVEGASTQQVRDLVLASLTLNGWTVQASGNNIITITKHGDSVIKEVNVGATQPQGTAESQSIFPTLGGSDGVTRGQATVGEKYKFSFLPLDGDTPALLTPGRVVTSLDGQQVSANVLAGQVPVQVAALLYNAMLAAGCSDAVLSGPDIEFLLNTQGLETLEVTLGFEGPDSQSEPASGLESLIFIPERHYVP